jgi:hypothetical protein
MSDQVENTNEFENVTFENQDTSDIKRQIKEMEYTTKIDHLDEHEPESGFRYGIFSFLSPEGVHNCKVRGVKLWDVARTESDGRKLLESLKKKEKYFPLFLGELGKWMAWDPEDSLVKEVVHDDKKYNKLVNDQRKKQLTDLDDLNTLAGKKKQQIEQKEVAHKKRVADSIKSAKSVVTESETKFVPTVDRAQAARDRLQKLKRLKDEKTEQAKPEDDIKVRQELLKQENERLKQKEDALTETKKTTDKVSKNLEKIKELMNKKNIQPTNN